MFEQLSERLQGGIKRLTGRGVIREADLDEALASVRTALLEADVSLAAVRTLLDSVRVRALGQEVLDSVSPGQQVVQVFLEEIRTLLDGDPDKAPAPFLAAAQQTPQVVLLVGLQGAGKTSLAAKLALHLAREGKKTGVVSLDLSRPAAAEQLEKSLARARALDEKAGGKLVYLARVEDAQLAKTAKTALAEAKRESLESLIIDTAGRTTLAADLMDEMRGLAKIVSPDEVLLVADAMTGQDAVRTAQGFGEVVEISGVVLTRADADGRGGAALSMRHASGQPVRFLGVGESPEALEVFDSDRIARRILGFGDLIALVEAASRSAERQDAEKADRTAKRFHKGKFDLNDMYEQLQALSGGGLLEGLLQGLPAAVRKKAGGMAPSDKELGHMLAILSSMTAEERRRPEVLQASRKRRIAKGSGTTVAEVNRLLKKYQDTRTVMKRLRKSGDKGLQGLLGGQPAAALGEDWQKLIPPR